MVCAPSEIILSERAPSLKEELNSDRQTYIDILITQFKGEDPKIAYRASGNADGNGHQ